MDIDVLAPQVDGLLINANRNGDRYRQYGFPVVPDRLPDHQGPLAGIAAELAGYRPAERPSPFPATARARRPTSPPACQPRWRRAKATWPWRTTASACSRFTHSSQQHCEPASTSFSPAAVARWSSGSPSNAWRWAISARATCASDTGPASCTGARGWSRHGTCPPSPAAGACLGEGLLETALELYGKAGDAAGAERVLEAARQAGDTFAAEAALRALGRPAPPATSVGIGETALAAGKLWFAYRAFEKADHQEGLERTRRRMAEAQIAPPAVLA